MSLTVTAVLLGTYRSKVTAQALSAATGSVDVLTVAHLLGTSPDEVRPIIRSVTTTASSGTPMVQVISYNGSQAVLALPPATGGSTNIQLDVICEFTHSSVR